MVVVVVVVLVVVVLVGRDQCHGGEGGVRRRRKGIHG